MHLVGPLRRSTSLVRSRARLRRVASDVANELVNKRSVVGNRDRGGVGIWTTLHFRRHRGADGVEHLQASGSRKDLAHHLDRQFKDVCVPSRQLVRRLGQIPRVDAELCDVGSQRQAARLRRPR